MIRQRSQRFVDLCCLQVDRPRGLLKVYSDRDWTSCWTARLYLHTQTDLCFYESESCITLTAAKLIRTSVSLWPNFICLVSFSIVPNWFTGTIVCIACCHTFTESVQLVWASAAQELTTSAIRGRGGTGRPKFTWKLLLKQWQLCGGDGALWLLTCASEIFVLTHTHTRLTALFPGLPRWAGTRKVKPIWILLKQETVSGSGISWAICKSAPCFRQTTTPTPHHSVFYRPDALPAAQPTASKHWRQQ